MSLLPIIVTDDPDTVATAVLELVKVNAPLLFELGTNENEASPNVFGGTLKLMVGLA